MVPSLLYVCRSAHALSGLCLVRGRASSKQTGETREAALKKKGQTMDLFGCDRDVVERVIGSKRKSRAGMAREEGERGASNPLRRAARSRGCRLKARARWGGALTGGRPGLGFLLIWPDRFCLSNVCRLCMYVLSYSYYLSGRLID